MGITLGGVKIAGIPLYGAVANLSGAEVAQRDKGTAETALFP